MEPTTLRNPEQITATPLESVFTWTLFLRAPLSAESWRFPESAPFRWKVEPGELGKVAIADSRIEPPRMPRFVKEMQGLGPRQHDERLIQAVLVPPSLRICAFAPWRETILCAISHQGAKAQWKRGEEWFRLESSLKQCKTFSLRASAACCFRRRQA